MQNDSYIVTSRKIFNLYYGEKRMREAKYISMAGLLFISSQALSLQPSDGHFILQAGGFMSNPGESQDVHIRYILGDQYTVNSHQDHKAVFGLGYLLRGFESPALRMDFGANAFYLTKTTVNGEIIQEHQFTNLGYRYEITHIPVYAVVKAAVKNKSDKLALTLDAGLGPNFNKTNRFQEWPINQSDAIPDYAYSGTSNTAFSATAGIGVKINRVLGDIPLECGYRFFYLGNGKFNKRSEQWLTNLDTGSVYAQALICGVAI